jgi:hypothetical protein
MEGMVSYTPAAMERAMKVQGIVFRAQRTPLRHLARPVAAGTAVPWDPDGGGGECLSARALPRGVQSPLSSRS